MLEQDPDLALVQALQAGDDSALNELMARHQEALYRFIYRYVINEQDAHDLTQEVFIRVYFKNRQFRPNAKFTAWLYRIATNLCRDHVRSKRYRQSSHTYSISSKMPDGEVLEREIPALEKNPADFYAWKEKLTALQQAIDELPHDLKTALILLTLENRSYIECAEILSTTPKAIETRVYRARKLLIQKMNKAGY